ncbi:MAG: 50S ribosomal protein L31e [Nanoarchaeota archaeon]
MAETKSNLLEREYTIPLRKEWTKVPSYKRTAKSIKAIKEFIAKHMKVPNRALNKVKIDSYLNNEVWYRGSATPPARVTVKATKSGDIVKVTFVTDPERVKFARERHGRKHVKTEKKVTAPEVKAEEVKTEEEKKVESEKEKSAAIANEKLAETQAKAQKHIAKDTMANKKAPIQRRRTIASN